MKKSPSSNIRLVYVFLLGVLGKDCYTQNILLGAGGEYVFNEERNDSWITAYHFNYKGHKILVSPAIEFSEYFSISFPVNYSSQDLSYTEGHDWRHGSPFTPYPNKNSQYVERTFYSSYNCLGLGLIPYVSLGKKIKWSTRLGISVEFCSMKNQQLKGSILKFHFDSTATYIEDSYQEFDAKVPDERLMNDYMMFFQTGFQFAIGKYLRIHPALNYRWALSVNSLSISRKSSWGTSLMLYYTIFTRRKLLRDK